MTSYSMCMSVRGGIKMLQAKRRNSKTYMTDDQGRPLSRDEAINAFMDELSKGREVIPMGKGCGNPCAYASCKGFDYKGGGCSGHDDGDRPRTQPIEVPTMAEQIKDEHATGLDAVDLPDNWEPNQ